MASHNVEMLKRGYAAFQKRDFDELVAVTHPDIEFTSLIRECEGMHTRGHEGVREFFESLLDVLPDWIPVLDSYEDHGDGACSRKPLATPARLAATSRWSRWMWQAIPRGERDGLAIRWDFFRTEEEARAALMDD